MNKTLFKKFQEVTLPWIKKNYSKAKDKLFGLAVKIWAWINEKGISFLVGLLTSGITISFFAHNKGCNYIVYNTGIIPKVNDSTYIQIPCPEDSNDIVILEPGNRDTTIIVTGVGIEGQHAKVAIDFLSKSYSWKYGNDSLTIDGERVKQVLTSYLQSSGGVSRLEKAKGIISVGTASYEGDDKNEYDRAERRIDEIQKAVEEATNNLPMYTLNLGRFKLKSQGDSYFQRRIILIRILSKDDNMSCESLEYALQDAFEKAIRKGLHLELLDYGNFKLSCFDISTQD